MIKAIIFDLDGVLVDATEWHYEALNEALRLFGFEITEYEHNHVYNGLPTSKKLELLTKEKGLPQGLYKTIQALKRKFTDEKVTLNCRPDYAKQVLMSNLKRAGFRLAACSNAQKYSVINMLERSQIKEYFDEIMGNDEGFKPKPAPDMYLAMFKKLGISPKEALIVEDSPHGIQSAYGSGGNVLPVRGFEEVNLSLFEDLL
jgi:HAD superfamily hydrolase (TIGR01509 family)